MAANAEPLDRELTWPLVPDEFYLPTPRASPARPVMQGDIFDDVPFVKAKRGNKISDPPNVIHERRLVVLLGYPCDIYLPDGRLTRVQSVAPVIDATKAGIPKDWDGAFTFAPLPELLGDKRMFAADLRVSANIDAHYINTSNRKRCLSEMGWAAFRQRLGLAQTRLINHLADLKAVGVPVWHEMELWSRWNETGRQSQDFQIWLNSREANLGGFTRRAALERGMYEVVAASLENELRD